MDNLMDRDIEVLANLIDDDFAPGVIYCPVCGKILEATNFAEVMYKEHENFIYVHDNVPHSDNDLKALEKGVN